MIKFRMFAVAFFSGSVSSLHCHVQSPRRRRAVRLGAALPMRPSPSLSADDVCSACTDGLQQPDEPTLDAGYERLFYFMTYACRKAVTARQGAESLANFTKYAELSPAVQPFVRAASMRRSEATIIAGTVHRGEMATVAVDVAIDAGFRHPSGFERQGDSDDGPEILRFGVRLQKERRPPLQGCWLITEILDARYASAGDMGNDSIAN